MTGGVISEVRAVTYVVLSKAEKHVPYDELFRAIEYITLYPRFLTNRRRYNRVHLYLYCNKNSAF